MGKKIHPNLFKQLSIFNTLQNSSDFFLVQKRFFHEIEIRWFLSQTFSQRGLDLQNICYEQSFSKGFLVRLDFLSLNSLVFFSKGKKRLFKKSISRFRLSRFKFMSPVSSSGRFRFSSQQKIGLNMTKKLLRSQILNSSIKPFSLIGVSSAPLFLANNNLKKFLRLLHRLLQKYKHLEYFSSTVLIATLGLTFPGFLNLFVTTLVKIFFKTRRHGVRLRFLKNLITLVFKNNRKISKTLGFLMQLRGRLDKRPRTELYSISLGKLKRQTIVGSFVSKNLQAITKNGTFGVFVYLRFSL